MAAAFFLPKKLNNTSNMEELRQLTVGQREVVDAYLINYEPSDYFDPDIHILIDTQTMILEMGSMCDLEDNALCDYLAEKGYSAYYNKEDAVSGWILRIQ